MQFGAFHCGPRNGDGVGGMAVGLVDKAGRLANRAGQPAVEDGSSSRVRARDYLRTVQYAVGCGVARLRAWIRVA